MIMLLEEVLSGLFTQWKEDMFWMCWGNNSSNPPEKSRLLQAKQLYQQMCLFTSSAEQSFGGMAHTCPPQLK